MSSRYALITILKQLIPQSTRKTLSLTPQQIKMCLLNLHTLELREFNDSERPPYAILSHTWGDEEISLQELDSLNVENKAGYVKILNFARKGKGNGFEWEWIDTCCIDNTSSAELSEAINSMYRVSRISL